MVSVIIMLPCSIDRSFAWVGGGGHLNTHTCMYHLKPYNNETYSPEVYTHVYASATLIILMKPSDQLGNKLTDDCAVRSTGPLTCIILLHLQFPCTVDPEDWL